jgi:hypothetical protein
MLDDTSIGHVFGPKGDFHSMRLQVAEMLQGRFVALYYLY